MVKPDFLRKKTPQEKQEHREMVKQIVRSCLVSSAIVLVCIILFELFFYINSIQHPKSFGKLLVWYQGCYLTLLLSSAACLALCIFTWRSYDERYRYMQWISPVYSAILLLWALSVTYLDCLKSNKCSPILFMTITLCIPACMYMNPLYYFIMDLIGNGMMLWMTVYAPGGGDTADIMNYSVFMIIQVIISMFYLATKYGYYKSVRKGLINEQKARKAVEAKAATLSNMSHELRTPLNAILGMNALIKQEDDDNLFREYTDCIKVSGDALLGLVNDMLDFSKLEAGKMTVNSAPYHLSALLDHVYNMMYVLASQKKLSFHIHVKDHTPDLLIGDSQRIQQLMINLIHNGIKYTKTGSVTLEVESEPGDNTMLLVRVIDTGIGIREQDLPFLFDSFSRVEDEQTHHIEGTGLGLMICERFIHLMNGEIGVQSTYGKGSTFWFRIPQGIADPSPLVKTSWYKDPAGSADSLPLPDASLIGGTGMSESAPSDAEHQKKPRILVVDDTPMNLKLFVKCLEKKPLIVDTAGSGSECLSMVHDRQYDMIFLDHLMPEMDGTETLRALRSSSPAWCREVKVIALTANGGCGAREEYLQLGFDDYLAKPISLNDLSCMVAPLIAQTSPYPEH